MGIAMLGSNVLFSATDPSAVQAQGVLGTGMQDIYTSWYLKHAKNSIISSKNRNLVRYVILTSFLIATVLGFLYLVFMEKCALCVIWTGRKTATSPKGPVSSQNSNPC